MEHLALVEPAELSLVENNSLNGNQLALILKKTPPQYVKTRPAKGGGSWEYVTGGYIKKCLNLMFGWDWDFEILEDKIIDDEAIVKGKLTCRSNGRVIVKMQYGNKDIMYKKQSTEDIAKGSKKIALSIGNDLKSAATDCLKKCAAEIGIASDIYNKADFKETRVGTEKNFDSQLLVIKNLFEANEKKLTIEEFNNIDRVITEKETTSYSKVLKLLTEL